MRLDLLRKKAEEIYGKKPTEITEFDTERVIRMVHDLQVSQIELEIQNEELRNTHQELQKTIDNFYHLYDYLPVGCISVDENCRIANTNKWFVNLVGKSEVEIINQYFQNFVHQDSRNLFLSRFKSFYKNPLGKTIEIRFNSEHTIDLQITAIHLSGKKVTLNILEKNPQLLLIIRDITNERKYEDKLKQQANLINQIPDAVVFTDIDFRIEFWNLTAEKIYGYSESEALGKDFRNLVKTTFLATDQQSVLNEFVRNGFWDGEVLQIGKNENIIPVYSHVSMIKNEGLDHDSVVAVNRPIKQDLNFLQKNFTLTKAIENSGVSIIITDNEAKILYANPRFSEVTGYETHEIIGKKPHIVKSGNMSAEFFKNMWDTLKSGADWSAEIQNKKKNGDLYWESETISSIKDTHGNIIHYVCVREDITERKKVQTELEEKNKLLQEMIDTKNKFFSIIAHDLRSPFNTILGFSDLLIQKAAHQDPEKTVQFAHLIKDAAYSTFKLLENLLEWAKLQTGNISPKIESVNFMETIQLILPLKLAKAKEKNIKINIGRFNSNVLADANMLQTVVRNLLTNAIKFTPSGGSITINCVETNEFSDIEVKDTGVGIPESNLPHLFSYTKNISTEGTNHERGSGLGLLLCKEFVDKMNGSIKVETEIDKGSKFIVRLPKTTL